MHSTQVMKREEGFRDYLYGHDFLGKYTLYIFMPMNQ